jgi:hypothetical protein
LKPPSKPPFGPDWVPFTQWAAIATTDRFISAKPLSGYRRHLPEDDVLAAYLEPDATEEVLGQATLEALDKSRFIHPHDDRDFFDFKRILAADKRWHAEFMKRYRYKTKRDAYANMLYCLVERREGWIIIEPHKRDEKPGLWWDLPEDKTILIPATDDPGIVGAAVKLALSRCE